MESVPPKKYGGTERVVSNLTEGLVARGHEVTLFASADSRTNAHLISLCKEGLRLSGAGIDSVAYNVLQLEEVVERASQFDIIHFHTDYLHYPISSRNNYPHITTLHGRLDIPGLKPLYKKFKDIPLVSISNDQRRPLVDANWMDTIYHGLPLNYYRPQFEKGKYLAFMGRISSEKRVDRAIEIAIRSQLPLRIAAKIDPADKEYFDKEIRHLLNHPLVEFIGEIGEDQKENFLSNAIALLFPIDWPEPFGLVMVESMSCGTPVIAWRAGSVPEVIDEGISGTVISSIEEGIKAVNNIHKLNRKTVRKKFEERFDLEIILDQYENIYSILIDRKKTKGQFRVSFN